MKERILSISEAAKQLQVESHVLRYWEEELDIEIPRNAMGHRLYGMQEMRLLYNIKELKRQGFQLRAIKFLLHEMKSGAELDLDNIVSRRDEIHRQAEAFDEEFHRMPETIHTAASTPAKTKKESVTMGNASISQERVNQFQYIMLQIMNKAMKENSQQMTAQLQQMLQQTLQQTVVNQVVGKIESNFTDAVSDEVATRIIKEINYLSRVQEEKEEAHYKQIDEVLACYQELVKGKKNRGWQRAKKREAKLAAAAKEPAKGSHKWGGFRKA